MEGAEKPPRLEANKLVNHMHVLRRPPHKRSIDDLRRLATSFGNFNFFKDLEMHVRIQVCRYLVLEYMSANTYVFKEGEIGEKFYVIMGGSVGVLVRDVTALDVEHAEDEEKVERARQEKERRTGQDAGAADDRPQAERSMIKTPSARSSMGKGALRRKRLSDFSATAPAASAAESAATDQQQSQLAAAAAAAAAHKAQAKLSHRTSMLFGLQPTEVLRELPADAEFPPAKASTSGNALAGTSTATFGGDSAAAGFKAASPRRTHFNRLAGVKDAMQHMQACMNEMAEFAPEDNKEWLAKVSAKQAQGRAPGSVSFQTPRNIRGTRPSLFGTNTTSNFGSLMRQNTNVDRQTSWADSLASLSEPDSLADSDSSGRPANRRSSGRSGRSGRSERRRISGTSSQAEGASDDADDDEGDDTSGSESDIGSDESASFENSDAKSVESVRPPGRLPGRRGRREAKFEHAEGAGDHVKQILKYRFAWVLRMEEKKRKGKGLTSTNRRESLMDAKTFEETAKYAESRAYTRRRMTKVVGGASRASFRSAGVEGPPRNSSKDRTRSNTTTQEGMVRKRTVVNTDASFSVLSSVRRASLQGPALARGNSSTGDTRSTPLGRKKTSQMSRRSSAQTKLTEVAVLGLGDSFGQVALQHDQPRSATIRTKEDCIFATLTRENYKYVLRSTVDGLQKEGFFLLREMQMFQSVPDASINRISGLLTLKVLARNEIVMDVGMPFVQVFFIKEGVFAVQCPADDPCAEEKKEDIDGLSPSVSAGAARERDSTVLSQPPVTGAGVAERPRRLGLQQRSIVAAVLLSPANFGLTGYLRGEKQCNHRVVCTSITGSVYAVLAKELVQHLTREQRTALLAIAHVQEKFYENRRLVLRHLNDAPRHPEPAAPPLEQPLQPCARGPGGLRRQAGKPTKINEAVGCVYSVEGRLRLIGNAFVCQANSRGCLLPDGVGGGGVSVNASGAEGGAGTVEVDSPKPANDAAAAEIAEKQASLAKFGLKPLWRMESVAKNAEQLGHLPRWPNAMEAAVAAEAASAAAALDEPPPATPANVPGGSRCRRVLCAAESSAMSLWNDMDELPTDFCKSVMHSEGHGIPAGLALQRRAPAGTQARGLTSTAAGGVVDALEKVVGRTHLPRSRMESHERLSHGPAVGYHTPSVSSGSPSRSPQRRPNDPGSLQRPPSSRAAGVASQQARALPAEAMSIPPLPGAAGTVISPPPGHRSYRRPVAPALAEPQDSSCNSSSTALLETPPQSCQLPHIAAEFFSERIFATALATSPPATPGTGEPCTARSRDLLWRSTADAPVGGIVAGGAAELDLRSVWAPSSKFGVKGEKRNFAKKGTQKWKVSSMYIESAATDSIDFVSRSLEFSLS